MTFLVRAWARRSRIVRDRYDRSPRWAMDGGNGSVARVECMETDLKVYERCGYLLKALELVATMDDASTAHELAGALLDGYWKHYKPKSRT